VARKNTGTDAGGGAANSSATQGDLDPSIARLSYEDAMAELERLVESIEQGDVGLEASLTSYRRGEQLLRHCKALLEKAETTVRQLSLADLESGVKSDLD
jgi:exodeoxyribonuclease VII small subunit